MGQVKLSPNGLTARDSQVTSSLLSVVSLIPYGQTYYIGSDVFC